MPVNVSRAAAGTAALVWQWVATLTPRIFLGVVMFLAFWAGGIIFQSIVLRAGRIRQIDEDLVRFLARSAKVVFVVFGLVTGLGTAGINVTALVAGLGLTGFALGFALKDVISNGVAGVLLILYNTLDRGQRIKVGAFEGVVEEVNLRYTVLRTEQQTIYVPNATLFTNGITVWREHSAQ